MNETFGDNYWQSLGVLGSGGQGKTYRVRRTAENYPEEYALKVLHSNDEQAIERFRRDAQAVSALPHSFLRYQGGRRAGRACFSGANEGRTDGGAGAPRGRQGGRPKVLSDDKRKVAQALRDDPSHSIQSICKTLGISRTTFYRYTQTADVPKTRSPK